MIHHEDLIIFLLFTPKFISAKGSNYPEFECLISILNLDSIYLIEHVYVHMCIQSAKTRPRADSGSDDSYICFTDYMKAFDYVDHNKLWEVVKRWEYQTTLPVFWETCMQDKQPQWELDVEQWTDSKLGKEYIEAVCCDPGI